MDCKLCGLYAESETIQSRVLLPKIELSRRVRKYGNEISVWRIRVEEAIGLVKRENKE